MPDQAIDQHLNSLDLVHSLIREVQLLLDFISGVPERRVKNLEIPEGDATTATGEPKKLKGWDIISRFERIVAKHDNNHTLSSDDVAFLELVRDELVHAVSPATGLTISYTAMVVGSEPKGRRRLDRTEYGRLGYAKDAYPGLVRAALFHRVGHYFILGITLILAMIAVSESARVALGKALLQTRQELRTQQAAIVAERLQLTADGGNQMKWGGQVPAIPEFGGMNFNYCEYASAIAIAKKDKVNWPRSEKGDPLPAYFSPRAEDLCERDAILAKNFGLSLEDLNKFNKDWPQLVGFPFNVLTVFEILSNKIFNTETGRHEDPGSEGSAGPGATSEAQKANNDVQGEGAAGKGVMGRNGTSLDGNLNEKGEDIEWIIAPVLLVVGNYALPMFFAALGAAAFVVLDFYDKVRDSTLSPRDHWLGWVRLVLGLIVGACIGLFASSYGPATRTPDQGLIGALTLSASDLAFLAGFGVEGVFGLLNALVKRVFAATPDRKQT
jgi:hypothetical protein